MLSFVSSSKIKLFIYSLSLSFICLITLQGLPTAIELSGISFVTTEPAPMTQFSPIVTPGVMTTSPPIQLCEPTVTGSAYSVTFSLRNS